MSSTSQNRSLGYDNLITASHLAGLQDGQLSSSTKVVALTIPWMVRFVYARRDAVWDAASLLVLLLPWRATVSFLLHLLQYNVLSLGAAGIIFTSLFFLATPAGKRSHLADFNESNVTENQGSPLLKPMLYPCRTTHTRFFPTKHSFSYSYLYVGIPIGWRNHAGTILSADSNSQPLEQHQWPWTWFAVEAENYLERGHHDEGLLGKLHDYLTLQGIPLDRYPHAYLVTAPRFLGFSFNPVSFWYLYTKSMTLGAMILEVNNTFDERRMYFLETSASYTNAAEDMTPFNHSWKKDFHVSPFNARDGSYSIRALDPFARSPTTKGLVDCNILLKSPLGEPKIAARVFSTGPPLEAALLTKWQTLVFVSRWWWVGFMTNPRILREARVLWVKKLQVYYRPEVFMSSIGRRETSEETEIEPFFHAFLQELVRCSGSSLRLKYTPAAGPRRGFPLMLDTARSGDLDNEVKTVHIRTLTPAFYSEFVRYMKAKDAVKALCFCAKDDEKMLDVSDPEAFRRLLETAEPARPGEPTLSTGWHRLSHLRRPGHLSFLLLLTDTFTCGYLRLKSPAPLSEIDCAVLDGQLRGARKEQYLRVVSSLLLADKVAFGWLFILRCYGAIIWLSFVVLAAAHVGSRGGGGGTWSLHALGASLLGFMPLHAWALLLYHWRRP